MTRTRLLYRPAFSTPWGIATNEAAISAIRRVGLRVASPNTSVMDLPVS